MCIYLESVQGRRDGSPAQVSTNSRNQCYQYLPSFHQPTDGGGALLEIYLFSLGVEQVRGVNLLTVCARACPYIRHACFLPMASSSLNKRLAEAKRL